MESLSNQNGTILVLCPSYPHGESTLRKSLSMSLGCICLGSQVTPESLRGRIAGKAKAELMVGEDRLVGPGRAC